MANTRNGELSTGVGDARSRSIFIVAAKWTILPRSDVVADTVSVTDKRVLEIYGMW